MTRYEQQYEYCGSYKCLCCSCIKNEKREGPLGHTFCSCDGCDSITTEECYEMSNKQHGVIKCIRYERRRQ